MGEQVWAPMTGGTVCRAQSLQEFGMCSDLKGAPSQHESVWFREGRGASWPRRSSG